MTVQRVVMPASGTLSWTVVDGSGLPLATVDAFLAHLTALARSPETVRAHTFSLKLFLEFLEDAGVSWQEAGPEDLSRFVARAGPRQTTSSWSKVGRRSARRRR